MTTATPTTRHETLADAFLFSATAGGVIHSYHGEFYVVAFESMEWAFSCGMRIETDFSELM